MIKNRVTQAAVAASLALTASCASKPARFADTGSMAVTTQTASKPDNRMGTNIAAQIAQCQTQNAAATNGQSQRQAEECVKTLIEQICSARKADGADGGLAYGDPASDLPTECEIDHATVSDLADRHTQPAPQLNNQ